MATTAILFVCLPFIYYIKLLLKVVIFIKLYLIFYYLKYNHLRSSVTAKLGS